MAASNNLSRIENQTGSIDHKLWTIIVKKSKAQNKGACFRFTLIRSIEEAS